MFKSPEKGWPTGDYRVRASTEDGDSIAMSFKVYAKHPDEDEGDVNSTDTGAVDGARTVEGDASGEGNGMRQWSDFGADRITSLRLVMPYFAGTRAKNLFYAFPRASLPLPGFPHTGLELCRPLGVFWRIQTGLSFVMRIYNHHKRLFWMRFLSIYRKLFT